MRIFSTQGRRSMRRAVVPGVVAAVVGLGCLQAAVWAEESPQLVQAGDRALRTDLQWLVDRGVVDASVTSWPIPVATLDDALRRAKITKITKDGARTPADQAALDRVARRIRQAHDEGSSVRLRADSGIDLPRDFSGGRRGSGDLSVRATVSNGALGMNLQLNAAKDGPRNEGWSGNPDGSYLSFGFSNQLLTFGRVERWWGPGMDGSMILSNAARPFTALSLQRGAELAPESRWLSWLGPWSYHVLMGELSDYRAVPQAKLFALRVTLRPAPGLEVGGSRVIQWGGRGRPQDFGTWWDAFLGRDNTGQAGITGANEPGNQIAGIDVRYTVPFSHPVTLYTQIVGEDEAGGLPYKNAGLLGLEGKSAIGTSALTWRVEAADTMADRVFGAGGAQPGVIYQHHIYSDGYYHRGEPIGHALGGDGQMVALGADWVQDSGRAFEFRLLRARVNPANDAINAAFPLSDTLTAGLVGVRQPLPWGVLRVQLGAARSERLGRTQAAAELEWEIELGALVR